MSYQYLQIMMRLRTPFFKKKDRPHLETIWATLEMNQSYTPQIIILKNVYF